ncbi:hypothetical protein TNCV_2990511 [Trichonephila clavipes]|nr:hypothetical protein TNCV_2990511 [Trichonephila clavipes]
MHPSTSKYCGVLSSDTASKPITMRNPMTVKEEAGSPSVIRGARNDPPHPDSGEDSPFENIEKIAIVFTSSLTNNVL